MSPRKAFLDTTVLTDILLKATKGRVARASLATFDETLLPVYAIKEFKEGPLRYYRWAYNTLQTTKSFADTLAALHSIASTPQRNLTLTAIEALIEASGSTLKGQLTRSELVSLFGSKATPDESLADAFRLSIKVRIYNAWDERRKVTTRVVNELACYTESDPVENRGLIELRDRRCKPTKECCLGPDVRKRISDVKALAEVVKNQSSKSENVNRYKVLHEIGRKPTSPLPEEYCKGLGDAYFALYCPKDATILTTNIKDHKPLAEALGKSAERPTA